MLIPLVLTLITKLYNDGTDIVELWETFKTAILQSIAKHVPSKTSKPKGQLPWLNLDLRRLLRQEQKLYNKEKVTNDWSRYRTHQKLCKVQMKQAEQDYINNTIIDGIANQNNKPFWKYIKSKRSDNIGTSPLKQNGNLVCEASRKAKILLNQFSSVFTTETRGDATFDPWRNLTSLPPLVITSDGVAKLLENINTSKASGADNLPNIYLKTCAQQLAPGLSLIFYNSVVTGQLPEDWRNAIVAPIYSKKGMSTWLETIVLSL